MKQEDVAQAFLETIVPEFPEAERTEEGNKEFQNMIHELYLNSLSRGQKRKYMNKENKFSNRIRKQLNKKK